MSLHELIFTNKTPDRYYRHIAFWIAHFIFWSFWAGVFFCPLNVLIQSILRCQVITIVHIFFTYIIVYSLSPKYLLTKKFIRFTVSFFTVSAIAYIIYVGYFYWRDDIAGLPLDRQFLTLWFYTMNFIISGPPITCAMFLSLKMVKSHYLKLEEKAMLIRETSNAELQLLKAQIHPHFLFNTLNNIYSYNLNRSAKAADLVLQLSDTLQYMVSDCEALLVPLEKEIKMLQDYIGLEKVRYGKRLTMTASITGNCADKFITPLLMIPFVENSFKHGASKMLEHPWIRMEISVRNEAVFLKISNSKPAHPAQVNGTGGIGLKNVRKRLELLYPGNYHLEITKKEDSFTVELRVPLTVNYEFESKINSTSLTSTYATA